MLTRTCCLAFSLLIGSAAVASAQPIRIKQFDAWGVYSYTSGGQRNCYALSVPIAARPTNVNHGDNFLLIAPTPNETYAPQAIMGYRLKPGSELKVKVEGSEYRMRPKERTAWLKRPAAEPEMVKAMQAGRKLQIQATSRRGTNTSYTFSLNGVTAALRAAKNCD